jgi:hypothetical protein
MVSQRTESNWEGSNKQINYFTYLPVQSFIFFILFIGFSLSIENRTLKLCDYRQLPVLFHNVGNQTVVFWWLMILRASTLRKQFLALHSQKMTHMLCLPVVEKFHYLTWWHSRCVCVCVCVCVSGYTTLIFYSAAKFMVTDNYFL